MQQEIASSAAGVIVLEAVKLLEAGPMVTLCDEVWVVTANPASQLRRLMENRGMDEAQARQRMQMQGPQAAKINQADRVIANDGTVEELTAQLDAIWEDLKRKYPERLGSFALSTGGRE
jgi:dephospho-CoA kinase